jgi:HSP20 family molecular chaperone IbpA
MTLPPDFKLTMVPLPDACFAGFRETMDYLEKEIQKSMYIPDLYFGTGVSPLSTETDFIYKKTHMTSNLNKANNTFTVELEAAGLIRDTIQVTVKDDPRSSCPYLEVRAKKRNPSGGEDFDIYRHFAIERFYGVDEAESPVSKKITYEDGILSISLPVKKKEYVVFESGLTN